MQLRSIIIDDEETGITALKFLIEKYIPEVRVVATCSRPGDAIEIIENYKPEIIFLDISMPEMNGFEVLEKLEWKNFNLIFTTAHQEYALKALKARATDYLLKPVYHKELRLAIDRIKEQRLAQDEKLRTPDYSFLNTINQYRLNKLAVTSKNGIDYIDTSEIMSLEARSNNTFIYLKNGSGILTTKRLGEFEHSLCSDNLNFMRVHHSFIINLHKVSRYLKETENIILSNNQKIPLAKSRKEIFLKWLINPSPGQSHKISYL
jgi:two-component system, LytTR family, response regulator